MAGGQGRSSPDRLPRGERGESRGAEPHWVRAKPAQAFVFLRAKSLYHLLSDGRYYSAIYQKMAFFGFSFTIVRITFTKKKQLNPLILKGKNRIFYLISITLFLDRRRYRRYASLMLSN